jgi:energy-converting hydrogenase Eha subunit B
LYERGKAISKDLKTSIIQDIVEQGGDITTGYFPGSLTEVAVKHRVKTELASICRKKIL